MSRALICLLVLCLLPALSQAQEPTPPAVTLPGGVTHLDDVGLYAVTYRYDDGRVGAMPVGWTGPFTDATGIACESEGVPLQPFGLGNNSGNRLQGSPD